MQPDPLNLPDKTLPPAKPAWTWFVLAYVAVVLAIDTMRAIHFRWAEGLYTHAGWLFSMQGWQLRTLTHGWVSANFLQSFDVFKFVFWFVVPVALCGRRLDLKAFSTARWRKFDWYLAGIGVVLALLAVFAVPLIPSLRAYYAAPIGLSTETKLLEFARSLVWTLSWLPGWEFMHRYFLLRPVAAQWPRYGWVIPAVFEWAYHLPKAIIEGLAMAGFSLLASQYILRRRNVALPFYIHLIIEVALPLSLLFSAVNPLVWLLH